MQCFLNILHHWTLLSQNMSRDNIPRTHLGNADLSYCVIQCWWSRLSQWQMRQVCLSECPTGNCWQVSRPTCPVRLRRMYLSHFLISFPGALYPSECLFFCITFLIPCCTLLLHKCTIRGLDCLGDPQGFSASLWPFRLRKISYWAKLQPLWALCPIPAGGPWSSSPSWPLPLPHITPCPTYPAVLFLPIY